MEFIIIIIIIIIIIMSGRVGEMRIGRRNRSTRRNLPQCHFVRHKSHMTLPGIEILAAALRSRRLSAWAMTRSLANVSFMRLISSFTILSIQNHNTIRQYTLHNATSWYTIIKCVYINGNCNYVSLVGFDVLTAMVMKTLFTGILRRVVHWKSTGFSEKHVSSIFRFEE
jgi:hypothetical protein